MDDDSRVIDKGWDTLPDYGNKSGDADEAVTVSISTTPGEWLVNTVDAVVVPMSMAELVEGLRSHKLTERSLVWRAGMQEWAAVDRVPQLKLAARMAPTTPSAVPPRPTPAPVPAATHSKPPPKPVRPTPPPQSTPPQFATSPSTPPQSLPSRKSTLPFGLQTPAASQSRPNHLRPSSSPRAALPPPASKDEPEVLAVYERPAATTSFDLSPVQPLRSSTPPQPPAPQTLAPMTTDSAQRRAPVPPRNADLSVVAASQFREVQRSSKRLVWVSSLASAVAASLLTFWASRGPVPGPTTIVEPAPAAAVAIPAAAARPAPVTPPSEPAPVEAHATAPSDPALAAPALAAPAKPKSARRAKVNVVPAVRPARAEADPGAAKDPSAEPNPYDVKLDEDPPAAKSTPVARGSGLDADSKTSEASASGSTSPGF